MSTTLTRLASQASREPRRKKFSRDEFYKLAERGLLDDGRRYELIDGDVTEIPPQKEPHPGLTMRFLFALARVFGENYVRCRMPVVFSDYSEPDPDISVASQHSDVYMRSLTTTPASDIRLIVEISVSSFVYDTTTRALLYAQGGVEDYWVLDVAGRRLIVHRDPTPAGYAGVLSYSEDEIVSPLVMPEVAFQVSKYLP